MKFYHFCLFTTFVLITVVQIGCLSGGVMGSAKKLVEAKDYCGAIEVYQSIVDAKPCTADARVAQLAMGELYIEDMNQPEQGIKTYEAIVTEAPASDEAAEAHYRLGMHAYRQKDYDTAQTQFETIMTQFPHLELSHDSQLMLAKSYEKGQKFEQAVQVFDNFANRNPQSKRAPQALASKARIQSKYLKDNDEAIRTLQLLVKKYGKIESAESYVKEAKKILIEFNVSPFGFGTYPKVPADFPFREVVQTWDNATAEHELLVRVRIKLWKQGTQTTGAGFDSNGLIYPTIPGVLYVQWKNAEDDDPEFAGRRYASLIMGAPGTGKKWDSLYLIHHMFERTDIIPDEIEVSGVKVYVYPDGIKVYEYPDGGIDPYKFLGFPRFDDESIEKGENKTLLELNKFRQR